jgi:hypothetical protein
MTAFFKIISGSEAARRDFSSTAGFLVRTVPVPLPLPVFPMLPEIFRTGFRIMAAVLIVKILDLCKSLSVQAEIIFTGPDIIFGCFIIIFRKGTLFRFYRGSAVSAEPGCI